MMSVFVKQHRGYIKGIVDYHRWHAEINMFLPFAEFDDSEDLAFLKEIAEEWQTVCFSPDEEGGIRVHIFINYFEELMSAEHKSYIEYDAIMQDKRNYLSYLAYRSFLTRKKNSP